MKTYLQILSSPLHTNHSKIYMFQRFRKSTSKSGYYLPTTGSCNASTNLQDFLAFLILLLLNFLISGDFNYRKIRVMPCIGKLFESILDNRLSFKYEVFNDNDPYQAGFKSNSQTTQIYSYYVPS